ncbi:MAG: 16S rRNA (guanine(527)-N(7))-methyltransferase RsmG [Hyphomicrobiales bacterium]|nr:16S rRNA (guanine(527)-N(7))-methyltransferase RsmG [Hyphomicrobiales bacterium]
MPPEPDEDSIEAVRAVAPVSRETASRLTAFVGLVRKWQRVENLISAKTLPMIWHRHVADSAQLVSLFPDSLRWLDLGTGAGFPGIVLACLLAESAEAKIDLLEANGRKCAFLRHVVREIAIPAVVHQGRIEALVADWGEPIDRVTARAVAPLNRLIGLSQPILASGTPAAFFKGADFVGEISEATQYWNLDLVEHKSRISENGVILEVRSAGRRTG